MSDAKTVIWQHNVLIYYADRSWQQFKFDKYRPYPFVFIHSLAGIFEPLPKLDTCTATHFHIARSYSSACHKNFQQWANWILLRASSHS